MKRLLLAACLFFIPSIANAQGYYTPRDRHLNHSNNFGINIYPGGWNSGYYQPGLSYYPNSGFYSYNYNGSRQWFKPGYISAYGYNSYYYNYNIPYPYYRRGW